MASQPSALTSALNTAPTPKESDPLGLVEELGKRNDMAGRGQYAQQQSAALLRGKSEAEGDVMRREQQIKQGELRKVAEAERGLADEAKKQYGEYEAGLKAPGEFIVPEYTASDYAKSAAQRLVSAFIIGGITKQSAKSQLQMIKSMQDAEDQGLDMEFQAARMKFDEAEKAKDKHNKRLKERFDSLMDLASKDRTAALAQAKLIEADVGEGLIAAKLRSGEWGEAKKLFDKATENLDKLRLEEAKAAKKATEPGKLSESDKKNMRTIGDAKQTLGRVTSTAQDRYFGTAKLDAIANAQLALAEKGIPIPDAVWDAFGKKVDAQTVNWWKDYYAYVAEVRNKLFGATLTPREQADFRNFNISPATSLEVAKEYFENQNRVIAERAGRELEIARAYRVPDEVSAAYLRMPELTQRQKSTAPAAGGPRPPTFANEAEAQAAFDAGKIKAGDEIVVGGVRGNWE